MDEVIEKHKLDSFMKENDHGHETALCKYSQIHILAAFAHSAYHVNCGMKIKLHDLQFACLGSRDTVSTDKSGNGKVEFSGHFSANIRKRFSRVLVQLLKDQFSKKNISDDIASNLGTHLLNSVYVSSLLLPSES